ncbi:MAG TPA: hypothetical protein VK420_06630, partial [Longimicrobium sp.]|nr:hypothetical protein [Longimicrobium sp.]
MHGPPWKCLFAALALMLAGCNGPRLASPDPSLPDAIGTRQILGAGRIPSGTFLTSGIGSSFTRALARTSPEQALENAAERDVILRILVLRLPRDVAVWWESGPGTEPAHWTHPLSEWERKYIEKMSASSVPEPVRMWPPVEPERLTP